VTDNQLTAPRPIQVVQTNRQLSKIRFSPCGNFLAAAGRDAVLRRWEINPIYDDQADTLKEAVDTKKSKTQVSTRPDLPELPRSEGHQGWATDLVFHPEQTRMISADSWGQIACRDYSTPASTLVWKVDNAHDGWVRQLAISPDGDLLASCGIDQKIRLWSTASGSKLHELDGHANDTYSVAFHPNGKSLVSGDLKGIVIQWDLATLNPVRRFDASVLYRYDRIQDVGGVRVLAFDREGKTLAVAGAKPETGGFVQAVPMILFFDWESAALGVSPTLGISKDGFVHDLCFHPHGYWSGVTSGQPGEGQFFLLRTGEQQPFFTTKLANCHSVTIHPDQRRVAIASNAGKFGQGTSKARQGEYEGNISPINLWLLPPNAIS
jgi:WD40 repeat protein